MIIPALSLIVIIHNLNTDVPKYDAYDIAISVHDQQTYQIYDLDIPDFP